MEALLTQGAAQLDVPLSAQQVTQFLTYQALLAEWNEKMNLTAITEPQEVITKHFLDSLAAAKYLAQGARVVDVGTGAGFPGLPLKIARADLSVTLLDSLNKRLLFLEEVTRTLSLSDVTLLHKRAEEGGRDPQLREAFDVAVSRAVANLRVLCELCLPYVKTGGLFIAYKGPDMAEELAEAQPTIHVLGGKLAETVPVHLPQSDLQHQLIMIKKVRQTPAKYPRQFAKITKSPIK